MSDSSVAAEFEKAAEYLRGIAGDMEPADLLYFYARFKQAKVGNNDTPKPGFFEFQGKQKWQAWKDLADMPAERAMREYVGKLSELDPGWAEKEPAKIGGWVSVSAMAAPREEAIPDAEKSLFDWVKEGNAAELRKRITAILKEADLEKTSAKKVSEWLEGEMGWQMELNIFYCSILRCDHSSRRISVGKISHRARTRSTAS